MFKLIPACLLLAAAGTCQAQVYQCAGPSGEKVLQQHPCPGGKRLDTRPVPRLGGTMIGGEDPARILGDSQRTRAVEEAIHHRRPLVGMTMEQLDQAMGYPTRLNEDDYGRGPEQQRIYERGQRSLYVYVKQGRVTAIQDREQISSERRMPKPTIGALR